MQTPLANAVKLANSQAAPKCQGWDADDPKGCWTHDMDRSAPIDYTEGFRLFENYDDAVAYGETLEGTFTLGLDPEIDRWAVTPIGAGTYGS